VSGLYVQRIKTSDFNSHTCEERKNDFIFYVCNKAEHDMSIFEKNALNRLRCLPSVCVTQRLSRGRRTPAALSCG